MVSVGSVYALVSVGFALVYGVLRLSNFSHGGVMVIGAYIGFLMMLGGIPWYISLATATLSCTALSMFIEFVALRRLRNNGSAPIYPFISSVTVLIVINNVLSVFFGSRVRVFPKIFEVSSISIGGVNFAKMNILIIGVCVVLLVALTWFLKKTKAGIAIRAAAADQTVCRLMGINTNLVISLVFGLAGALAGTGGMFLGMSYSVYPDLSNIVGKAFMATVIGGLGSLPGAVIGAFLLAIVETLLQVNAGWEWISIGSFALGVLFLLLRPRGILGEKIETKV
jgi:branched-chain amino acid transport system permease protein